MNGAEKPLKLPDAGLRSLEHCMWTWKPKATQPVLLTSTSEDNRRLPPWRRKFRDILIPIVRWETPYLADLQRKWRNPVLDSYFAFTANLGTHTFFMIILPILFWCGQTTLGRG